VLGALRAIGGTHIGKVHLAVLDPQAGADGPVFASEGERYVLGCARLTARVAAALEHAHGKGVIHRDLKPSNILLTTAGDPMITDFGLATRFDSGADRQTRMGMGTPHYMPPEAFRITGRPAPSLDVYALGVILYELLTLRLPFEGKSVAELPAAMEDRTYPKVNRVNPAVDARLTAIVERALDPDADTRLQTAGELRDLLERYVEQLTIPEVRASQFALWARRVRRRPWKYAAIGLAVVAIVELILILLR
jgi:serine/threonine protein kinase